MTATMHQAGRTQDVNGCTVEVRHDCGGRGRSVAPVASKSGEEEVVIETAGREVTINNPGKVLFSERGDTKLDLVHYYQAVEEPLMRAMGGRPVLLQRFPNGASGPSFFQKRVPENRPQWLQTVVVSTPNGTTSQALVAHDLAHVLWAVNLACLGFHVWPSQASDPDHADQLRIDLDPTPGVTFAMVQEAAEEVRRLFEDLGVVALPKTTGNRGIHVFSRLQPRWTSYDVRAAAVAVARELERRRPDLITAGGGRRNAARGSSSTSTKTPRTRRSSAHGRCGRVLVRRSRRRSTGTSWPRSSPTT